MTRHETGHETGSTIPLLLVVYRPLGAHVDKLGWYVWNPSTHGYACGTGYGLGEITSELRSEFGLECDTRIGWSAMTGDGWWFWLRTVRKSPERPYERQRGANPESPPCRGVLPGEPGTDGEGDARVPVRYGDQAPDQVHTRGSDRQHPSPAGGTAGRLGCDFSPDVKNGPGDEVPRALPPLGSFPCEHCGGPLVVKSGQGTRGGRYRRFCSDRCRQAAWRAALVRP